MAQDSLMDGGAKAFAWPGFRCDVMKAASLADFFRLWCGRLESVSFSLTKQ